jgi:hypothetical protein
MTARVSIADGRLRIDRSGAARWFGASVDVPLSHVVSVARADQQLVRRWNKGIRLAGIEIPRRVAWGVYRQDGKLTWWDIGRGRDALRIMLRDERLDELMVEVEDPAAVMQALDAGRTQLGEPAASTDARQAPGG